MDIIYTNYKYKTLILEEAEYPGIWKKWRFVLKQGEKYSGKGSLEINVSEDDTYKNHYTIVIDVYSNVSGTGSKSYYIRLKKSEISLKNIIELTYRIALLLKNNKIKRRKIYSCFTEDDDISVVNFVNCIGK